VGRSARCDPLEQLAGLGRSVELAVVPVAVDELEPVEQREDAARGGGSPASLAERVKAVWAGVRPRNKLEPRV
jgi:hypothetical protein